MGTSDVQDEQVNAKKAVAQCTIPELINHIRFVCPYHMMCHMTINKDISFTSGINLETAARISELIVERTLDELDSCSIKLVLTSNLAFCSLVSSMPICLYFYFVLYLLLFLHIFSAAAAREVLGLSLQECVEEVLFPVQGPAVTKSQG